MAEAAAVDDGSAQDLARLLWYFTAHAPGRQRLSFWSLCVVAALAVYWRDNDAIWRSDLFNPWASDGPFSYVTWSDQSAWGDSRRATHTLAGKLADTVADVIEAALPTAIAVAVYQYFRDRETVGKLNEAVIAIANDLNLLTSRIESCLGQPSEPLPAELLGRGSSEQRRGQRQAFADALERIAPQEHARHETRARQQRASWEGVRAQQNRERQHQLENLHAQLEECVSRAKGIALRNLEDQQIRRRFEQAVERALLAMLQQGFRTRDLAKLQTLTTATEEFLQVAENTDDSRELSAQAAVAREFVNDLRDQGDRHSARVNVTLHSLDENNHLVMRTLAEEPMSNMFPTSMSIELLNLIKEKRGKEQRSLEAGLGQRYALRACGGSAIEHDDDFVGLGGIEAPSAPTEEDGRDKWEERHRQRITDQIVNRISTFTAEGHVARDMGLAVVSKAYEFGLTYELPSGQESNPNESDVTGGSWVNNKFRLLMVGRDVLVKARQVESESVCAPGLSGSHSQFIKKRWKNIQALAQLCDDADERPVKKRRLLYSGASKSVELCLTAKESPTTSPNPIFTLGDSTAAGGVHTGASSNSPPTRTALRRTRSAAARGAQ